MRTWLLAAALLLPATLAAAAPEATPALDFTGHTPHLGVNAPDLPDACLADFSSTLRAPAGREGFLFAGTDGHLYFESGRRAIFWGVTIANDAVFQSHERIDAAADRLARAGFNLVRFHHLDGPGGLLPAERAGQTPRIDPQKLEALDYWVAALRQRGIYIYLDLLSYRTFYPEEGVEAADRLGRGAKPYAVFAERLMELQLQYARELLADHVNPYTKLSYCSDPTICLIELYDENGLFALQDKLGGLVPPYREELARKWNYWLRQRFADTASLKRAWGTGRGSQKVLSTEERLEAGTVILPGLSPGYPASPGRTADARRFMADVQREYFVTMRDTLRKYGVRVPLLAVGDTADPADLYATAAELDAVGCNWYFAHPDFRGGDWQPPTYCSMSNPLGSPTADSFLRRACGPRVWGRPLILREANTCWPNPYRAAGILQAAAYAALNDLDAVILFTYDPRPEQTRLDFFNIARDPTRWGLAPLAGRLFLGRLIGPASLTAAVSWGAQDPVRARPDALEDGVYELGAWCGFGNLLPLPGLPPKPELALEVSSGATDSADYFSLGESLPVSALPPEQWQPLVRDHRLTELLPQIGPASQLGPGRGTIDCRPGAGLLRVHGAHLEALAGDLAKNSPTTVGPMALQGGPDRGALVWYGLDGAGPGESTHWLLKLVGNAANTGEQLAPHERTAAGDLYELRGAGGPPIVTCTGPTTDPTVVSLNGTEVLRMWAKDAVVELARDGDHWFLFCDAPGVRLQLPQLAGEVMVTVHTAPGPQSTVGRADLTYPEGALLLEIAPR